MEREQSHENAIAGQLRVLERIESPQLGNRRDIQVYLPPSYEKGQSHYPVIYMHDGQNLFDEASAFAGEWKVQENMQRLSELGIEAIVVGIPNMGEERCDEYSPFVDPRVGGGCGGRGDAYLAFVVETVKPLVDDTFRTKPSRESTGMVGSSMGGLITLYAYFRHSETFGFAGVMSPSLWFGEGAIFSYLEQAAYIPGHLYLDIGTAEGQQAVENVQRLHALLVAKGYGPGETLLYVEDEGADHSETSWARRLRTALYFLVPVGTKH